MEINSKFNIGDKVYFWSTNKVKIIHGEIDSISIYVTNSNIRNSYGVIPIKTKNDNFFALSEQVPEHLIFRERDDVFEFCMKLTEYI